MSVLKGVVYVLKRTALRYATGKGIRGDVKPETRTEIERDDK